MFLRRKTEPLAVKRRGVSALADAMRLTGFQGRKLGETIEIWKDMLREERITIFIGIAGALVPAGMRKIIAYFIKKRMVDVVVSTGANLFHDIHEALGSAHWLGDHTASDSELLEKGIDRIYDVFAVEREFRRTDRLVQEFINKMKENYNYSSREFFELLGKELLNKGCPDSMVAEAAKHSVPIYCPALCDSSIGYSFLMARRGAHDSRDGKRIILGGRKRFVNIDQMKDIDETVQIAERAGKTGVIYVGGGVPKNFIQQTELVNLVLGKDMPGHEYAIQVTTDAPHWGGLSGCTFEEAQSWGKVARKAKKAICYCDATLALPIISHALSESAEPLAEKRKKPHFRWNRELKLVYK